MPNRSASAASISLASLLAATLSSPASAATPTVTQPIDNAKTVVLPGNVRPEAKLANDRGALPDNTPIGHMQLLLKRDPATQAALDAFVASLSEPASPNYHKFLTATEYAERFGPAEADTAAVIAWLQSQGFTVNGVAPSRMLIDFSGTAGTIQAAFHTEMHRLSVNGASHIANMSGPRIPVALAGAISGIVSLNDFRPHTNFKTKPQYTVTESGTTYELVAPGDLATIYNFNPVFAAGYSGQGQTVVVIEDTNIYAAADFTSFRNTFGLSSYTGGTLVQAHPTGSLTCTNPGVVSGNEEEAELDMEWASAAAPSATIEVASCKDGLTTFGGLTALENIVNAAAPPAIISISYGECEAENGASANAAYYDTYEQAAGEGISVFVSAGDEGAASCDADEANATHGIGVSGFASTPYNVAVGGTDFGDTYAGTNTTYWSSSNSSTYESAKSYVPEIPWNDSCASTLIATKKGYTTTYGSSGFCSSRTASEDGYLTTASGSGGPSGCATGSASTSGVVSGTCKGWPKPSWQSVLNNPADGVRDIPDVALFAANGVWNHYYPFCDTDTKDGGTSCTSAPVDWPGAGGTSFASPIMAGIQALINQKYGKQGNPNPTLYKLASTEYGTAGSSACNSTSGNATSSSCTFYDVTLGDMDVNCTGSHSCYKPSGSYGVLSTSTSAYAPAYKTGLGWDFATGIGSVNVSNLFNNW